MQFGPIRMDVLLKKNIERVLQQGIGDFQVKLLSSDGKDRDVLLRIGEASITLLDTNGNVLLELGYTINNPVLETNLKDSSRMLIELPEQLQHPYSIVMSKLGLTIRAGEPSRLELKFSSRINRDIFLFSHKAFAAKKELGLAHILNHVETSLQHGKTFDYLLEIESLRFDLYRMILANSKLAEERDFFHAEVSRLQQQLANISSDMMLQSGHKGATPATRNTPNGNMQTPEFMDTPNAIPPFQMEAINYPELDAANLALFSTQQPENFVHHFTVEPPLSP